MTIREKVLLAINETSKNLYEREELAKLIWETIGADLNLLMLGDPGTAKTMIATNLTKVIDGSKIFRYTLNSFTTVDEIFGHYDIIKLKNDNILKRNTSNKLLEAHIAYLDEFFKSNSGTLNALLDVMNDKTFIDSHEVIKLPLRFLISSSNELPNDEDNLEAVLDRFQVKYLVSPIQDRSTRINAYMQISNNEQEITPVITLEEIDEFRKEVQDVEYTKEVAELTEKIYNALIKENIYVSDRTVFKSIKLVKSRAYLSGRTKTDATDLVILKDSFWSAVNEIKPVRSIIYDIADPISGKVEEIWDAITETIETLNQKIKKAKNSTDKSSISFELIKKINHARDKLKKQKDSMKRMNMDTKNVDTKLDILERKADELFDAGSILK